MHDDRLRLIFTCCHPALSREAQVALTLRLLGGLSTEEVARSFLVAEPTMAKRLVRAKRKIKAARIPYRAPADHELPDRLPPGPDRLAPRFAYKARRVARHARRAEDRSRWDRASIEEAQAIVRRCIRRDQPGPYQVQVAINAVHADAASFEETDWSQILALYDHLLALAPTPVVALNRAIAIGDLDGPAAALDLVDELDLEHYYPAHATRADLLQRLGRPVEAATEYERAAALAPTDAERDYLRRGGRAVSPPTGV